MTESKRLSPDSKNIETPLEALATRRDEGVAARECAALSSADRDLEMDGRTIGRSGSLIPSSSVVETRVRDLAGPSTSVCGYYDLFEPRVVSGRERFVLADGPDLRRLMMVRPSPPWLDASHR